MLHIPMLYTPCSHLVSLLGVISVCWGLCCGPCLCAGHDAGAHVCVLGPMLGVIFAQSPKLELMCARGTYAGCHFCAQSPICWKPFLCAGAYAVGHFCVQGPMLGLISVCWAYTGCNLHVQGPMLENIYVCQGRCWGPLLCRALCWNAFLCAGDHTGDHSCVQGLVLEHMSVRWGLCWGAICVCRALCWSSCLCVGANALCHFSVQGPMLEYSSVCWGLCWGPYFAQGLMLEGIPVCRG